MWSSAWLCLPQTGGERPVRLTQGSQRACLRSSVGPSLRHHTPTGTPRSTHIRTRTGVFVCLHLHAPPQHVDSPSRGGTTRRSHPRSSQERSMEDPASELPRTPLPRTSVNKASHCSEASNL